MKLFSLVILLSAFVAVGCTPDQEFGVVAPSTPAQSAPSYAPIQSPQPSVPVQTAQIESAHIKIITISGVNAIREVDETDPVELKIIGTNDIVTVKEGTVVDSALLGGVNNILKLPRGSKPEITQSGVNTRVEYY